MPTSVAQSRALRAKYEALSPKLARLFRTRGEVSLSCSVANIDPASAGFVLEDAPLLANVAAEYILDDSKDDAISTAPLHAMHALLRLGSQAGDVAPVLARRAARTTCDRGDYVTEILSETLCCLFAEMSDQSVPALLEELGLLTSAIPGSSEAWRLKDKLFIGGSIIKDSLLEIALGSDVERSVMIARALLAELTKLNTRQKSGRRYPSDQGIYFLVLDPLTRLLPLVRDKNTLKVLRETSIYYTGNEYERPDWLEIFGAVGVAASSLDPLLSLDERAKLLWGEGNPAPSAPFPGQPGYEMPEHFISLPCCGWFKCGWSVPPDLTNIHNIEQPDKYKPENAASNVCSGCFSVRYCSPECQKAHWTGHTYTPPTTPLDTSVMGDPPGGLWRLTRPTVTLNANCHKSICRLIRLQTKQRRGAAAEVKPAAGAGAATAIVTAAAAPVAEGSELESSGTNDVDSAT